MTVQSVRPKVGLLVLTLELYETLLPDLRTSREKWLRKSVIPALQRESDVVFDRACFDVRTFEAGVAGFETAEVDALLVFLTAYSPIPLPLPRHYSLRISWACLGSVIRSVANRANAFRGRSMLCSSAPSVG